MKDLKPGNDVAFTRGFLATMPDRADWRGKIEDIENGWLATVIWRHCERTKVNVDNLCRPGSLAFFEEPRR